MHTDRKIISACMAALLTVWTASALGQVQQATKAASSVAIARDYQSAIQPLLAKYCYECHAGDRTEAEIDLAEFPDVDAVRKQMKTWLKVREMIDSSQMPPVDSPQLSEAEQKQLQDWVRTFLTGEAAASAGDPGPVVLRRLNNPEYDLTVRDLTGVATLKPTREFPVDGAAGEGFINTGAAQSMSPSLVTKYLDAAKEIATHAVLLPDGIRFSPHTTRRDHTDELLASIQTFYRNFTEDGGGLGVDLQGVKFDTNQGGLLPVRKYITATLEERAALANQTKTIADVARERCLNARYLETLWYTLSTPSGNSLLLDGLREKWLRAKPEDAAALAEEIALAQKALWKFNSVGQLGGDGTQKIWMEAASPVIARHDMRLRLNPTTGDADQVVYLAAHDLGDGRNEDFVVWDRPRLEFLADATGFQHPPLLLRDLRHVVGRVQQMMASEIPRTTSYLDAVSKLRAVELKLDDVAKERDLNPRLLEKWAEVVGLGHREKPQVRGHFTTKMVRAQGYEAINGWGTTETPNMLTNQSKDDITFLTLTVPARSVVVHPSPTQESLVAWSSPFDGEVQLAGRVADADHKCGNGAAWRVELLAESGTTPLADGVFDNGGVQQITPQNVIRVRQGDVVFLIVNSRDSSHACDTTHVELKLSEVGGEQRIWDLAADVVDRILEANPLPDTYGHANVWHFGATGGQPQSKAAFVPGSSLAQWRTAVIDAKPADEIQKLAESVRNMLTTNDVAALSESDRTQRELLLSWKGPLRWISTSDGITPAVESNVGLSAALFGKHPNGSNMDVGNLCVQAPDILEVRLPAALASGAEVVVSGELHAATAQNGSVQLQLLATKPETLSLSLSSPILVRLDSDAQKTLETGLAEFRDLFPAALCYARIVPVDEVVTMTLYFREDDHLRRLMLDESQAAELDRLWDELLYVAQEPISLTVAYEQIYEFATQDRPDLVKAFEPMRQPINDRADVFRQRLIMTEPAHVDAVLEFADRAWRRPLSATEQAELRELYQRFRADEIPHEDVIRLVLARTLTSPAFLYRRETPGPGKEATPISDSELASRLSYFLWSSMPDAELRLRADAGTLSDETELISQTRRMLKDSRSRQLAIQFACQWLHLRDFDQNDDKNEALFPEFAALRGEMYEETVRFFEDMVRNDGSILGLLDADHTFLNESLAKHYGIEGVKGADWRRVDGVQARGRGGVLGMATLLASQSGASRTSPILRGNWIYETLLGERLPRPPANVPVLPDAVPTGLTERQLIEQHSSAPECAKCHKRIDPYGFALEQYDAIGRLRTDTADTKTKLMNGKPMEGINGLRDYLRTERRDDVVRQFCRKLLGFALGREVQLSDELLLAEMQHRLAMNEYRFQVAVETIVTSPQFLQIRGREFADE